MTSDDNNNNNFSEINDKKKINYDLNRILDLINLRIIEILEKNAMTTFIEIARIVGTSDATVHLRIKKLQQSGIIKKFTILINNCLLGYRTLVFIGVRIKQQDPEKIVSELVSIDEVLEVHEIYSYFDILIKLRTKDLEHLREIVALKIKKIDGIEDLTVMNVLKTNKDELNISLDKEIENRKIIFFD